jgi:hypothetical protein
MKSCETIEISIWIAGDINQARQVCREFCREVGFCVTLTEVDYIYTGGEERGIRVGIINYPKYKSDRDTLFEKAEQLAEMLRVRLCQRSYSIMAPDYTVWFDAEHFG